MAKSPWILDSLVWRRAWGGCHHLGSSCLVWVQYQKMLACNLCVVVSWQSINAVRRGSQSDCKRYHMYWRFMSRKVRKEKRGPEVRKESHRSESPSYLGKMHTHGLLQRTDHGKGRLSDLEAKKHCKNVLKDGGPMYPL